MSRAEQPVVVGQAHVPWAPPVQANKDRPSMQAGWVLPGGKRVETREEAERAAAAINDLFIQLTRKP